MTGPSWPQFDIAADHLARSVARERFPLREDAVHVPPVERILMDTPLPD